MFQTLTAWLPRPKTTRRGRRLSVERLEDLVLPTTLPLTLADPSLYGLTGLGASTQPSISADGQLVVFESTADNLVPNDNNGQPDVFVYNRATGSLTLVSVNSSGVAAGVDPDNPPVISPDGRYVVFESSANNIVPGFIDPNGYHQLYLFNLATGTASLLAGSANSSSSDPVFSADSHHVAFLSQATNLVSGITYNNPFGTDNLFEQDLTTGTTALVPQRGNAIAPQREIAYLA
jgi:Tol biopolymer transport system component